MMRRTQIYPEESQHEILSKRTAAAGTTTSGFIREAVDDAYLAGPHAQQRQSLAFRDAVRAVAGSVPWLPQGSRYVESSARSMRIANERSSVAQHG